MPISKKEFKEAEEKDTNVIRFLRKNKDKAFYVAEIARTLGISASAVVQQMRRLRADNKVIGKDILNKKYYMYNTDKASGLRPKKGRGGK